MEIRDITKKTVDCIGDVIANFRQLEATCKEYGLPLSVALLIDNDLLHDYQTQNGLTFKCVNSAVLGFIDSENPERNSVWFKNVDGLKYEVRVVNAETKDIIALVSYENHRIFITEFIR